MTYAVALACWSGFLFILWLGYEFINTRAAKKTARKLETPEWIDDFIWVFVGCTLFFVLHMGKAVVYNNYNWQAQAWLNGTIDVPDLPLYLESVQVDGKTFMHFAPGPAVLALPFVYFWGVSWRVEFLPIILGGINLGLINHVLRALNLGSRRKRIWMTGLIGLGCVHAFCAAIGWSWFLGHVSGWFFLFAALAFAAHKKGSISTFFAGLLFGAAVSCRMALLLSFPLFAYLCIYRHEGESFWRRINFKNLIGFCIGAGITGGLYMLFNYMRYDTIMDLGYTLTFAKDRIGQVGGPLQLKFVPYNLYSIFILAPEFINSFPYIIPKEAGVSLTFTTPAIFYALHARSTEKVDKLVQVLWFVTFACAVPFLMNYGNGMMQFSMRYASDFLPFLLLLACIAINKHFNTVSRFWIILSIWAQGWGILYWNYFYIK